MAFRINYKGVDVFCETIEELDMLADRLRNPQNVVVNNNLTQDRVAQMSFVEDVNEKVVDAPKKRGRPGKKTRRAKTSTAKMVFDPNQPKEEQYLSLLGSIQKGILVHLAKFSDGQTDRELRQEFKFGANTVLAGYLSNIYKMANKVGMRGEDVITKVTLSNVPGNQAYRYTITNYGKELVEKMGPI